jgi:transposase
MIGVEEKEQIRRAYFVDKKSKRKIARERQHTWKTIDKALTHAGPGVYRLTKPRPRPVVGELEGMIAEILEKDKEAPRKQRHTARRIYNRLVEEHQYEGSEPTVRRAVARWRCEHESPVKVFFPIEHPPGKESQIDFGEAEVILGGRPTITQLYAERASFSGALFVQGFPHQRQEVLFEGMSNAAEYFRGVFPVRRFDNLTQAVRRILRGHGRIEQEIFIAYRSHHLFEAVYCNPASPHEKGGVENIIGFARRNFLTPVPDVADWSALNRLLLDSCRADMNRTAAGQTQTIAQRFETERSGLLPLPAHRFECCRAKFLRATSQSLVAFEQNRYSVPVHYAYHPVTLKAFVWEVHIAYRDRLIAKHPRLSGTGQDSIDPMHYLPLLEKKPGAWISAKPFVNWNLPAAFHDLHRLADSGKTFAQILRLLQRYSPDILAGAIGEAIARKTITPDAVQCLADRLMHPAPTHGTLDSGVFAHLDVKVPIPSTDRYNALLVSAAQE